MQRLATIARDKDILIVAALLLLASALSTFGIDILAPERLKVLNNLLLFAVDQLIEALKGFLAI